MSNADAVGSVVPEAGVPPAGLPEAGAPEVAQYYKREFWSAENLKFDEPWYRLAKVAKLINKLAPSRQCSLLDVGCGPAALKRLLSAQIDYYGIDIAIKDPSPDLLEADLLKSPIAFGGRTFDLIVAQGLFEYMGDQQSQKFQEVATLLKPDGKFVLSYTNFGHRKTYIYPAFSNVQPFDDFRRDLERYFVVEKCFPASHNWKHSQPDRKLVKAANMHVNLNIPVISPLLAVDYFVICSRR
jgi:SAM-dependent methyltransferase